MERTEQNTGPPAYHLSTRPPPPTRAGLVLVRRSRRLTPPAGGSELNSGAGVGVAIVRLPRCAATPWLAASGAAVGHTCSAAGAAGGGLLTPLPRGELEGCRAC